MIKLIETKPISNEKELNKQKTEKEEIKNEK